MEALTAQAPRSTAERILAVVDWDLEPGTTAHLIAEQAKRLRGRLGILVPARLHGLDWAGDPHSSEPCAERQLSDLQRLLAEEGVQLEAGWVGGPETIPAIADVLDDWSPDEVMLMRARAEHSRLWPLSLSRRVRWLSGLPVSWMRAPRR